MKLPTMSAARTMGPFLALPYLVHLHRHIVVPERIRQRVWGECRDRCREAERQMLALEQRQSNTLSSSRMVKAKDLNRRALAKLHREADSAARGQLVAHVHKMEASLRHLHSQPFQPPQAQLDVLFAAETDSARSTAAQAIANHMLLFLRIPLQPARVSVMTTSSQIGDHVAGFYVPPGFIRIHRANGEPASRILTILAHEMCHHLLNAFQIQPAPGLDNERMTDAAAIYFNFTMWLLPEYQPKHLVMDQGLFVSRLGYLKPSELERAHRFARIIQSDERPFSSLVEPGGIRVQKDSLGNRVKLPFNPSFHGIIVAHFENRLQFSACDLLAPVGSDCPTPEFTFITNKVSAAGA